MADHTRDGVREASETETLPTDLVREDLGTMTHSPNHAKEAHEIGIHSHGQGKEDLEIETRTRDHHGREGFATESLGSDHGKVASVIETLSLDREMVDEMVGHIRVQDLHDPMEAAIGTPADRPA
jgi:hypothetical protein